jgi:hypothetical protein
VAKLEEAKQEQRSRLPIRSIYVTQPPFREYIAGIFGYKKILAQTNFAQNGLSLREIHPQNVSEVGKMIGFPMPGYPKTFGALRFIDNEGNSFVVVLRFRELGRAVEAIVDSCSTSSSLEEICKAKDIWKPIRPPNTAPDRFL